MVFWAVVALLLLGALLMLLPPLWRPPAADHTLAAPANEQREVAAARELGPHLQPVVQRRERLLADGDDARLRTLAEHTNRAVRDVDVAQVQAHELREP